MQQKIGILLVNLGTPNSPSRGDVATYLTEFLTDERVIDIPWIRRQLLVRGVIAPFRSGSSAKSYKEIWDDKGSPLKYYSEELTEKVQQAFDEIGHSASEGGAEYYVELAMRYQNPSVASALNQLRAKKVTKYIVFPLFPQYASATTGSVHAKVMSIVSKWQTIPDMVFINSYHNHPAFIKAFATIGRGHDLEAYDHILFSYHGLPKRQLRKADESKAHCQKVDNCCAIKCEANQFCYSAQCVGTTEALAKALNIPKDRYGHCYQSRLGRDPWVEPYTSDVLEHLAEKGVKKVLVFCPAFVADCIETIFEIGVEYQEEFEEFGGEKVSLVESLNAHPVWVEAVKDIVLEYI